MDSFPIPLVLCLDIIAFSFLKLFSAMMYLRPGPLGIVLKSVLLMVHLQKLGGVLEYGAFRSFLFLSAERKGETKMNGWINKFNNTEYISTNISH